MTRRSATLLLVSTGFITGLMTHDAGGSDVAMGRLLAASHCAVCHAVTPGPGEVADAPGFALIGHKYNYNSDVIATIILGPHPKMNFVPRRADAEDIAAYIATLPR
jgi:mono/diheme cytochrome c family protein